MHKFVCPAWLCSLAVLFGSLLPAAPARGDTFVYRDADSKQTVEIKARLVGSAQATHVLETADGQFHLIPESAVMSRELGPEPEPLDPDGMIAAVSTTFGADKVRSWKEAPFVLVLELHSPLPKNAESRASNFLRKAGKFMKNVETAFLGFVKEARIDTKPPKFPLVVLIFESEDDFNAYSNNNRANRVAGFYSKLTNFLAIRMSECMTFDVPLHEAIHQQVYNRNVLQRLAPIPRWFDEGIATGFEANQGKINIGPSKISARYAREAIESRTLTWDQIVQDDAAFGDNLVNEAYGHAWSIHWMLVTKYKAQYGAYLRELATKQPLEPAPASDRLKDFRTTVGKDPAALQKEFRVALDAGIKRQKVSLIPEKPPGFAKVEESLGKVELSALRQGAGPIQLEGKLTNLSPLRPMAFHVTVETDVGTYAEWHIPELAAGDTTALPEEHIRKQMKNSPGGSSNGFRVRIKSAPTDSDSARKWKRGELPVPVYTP